MRGALAAVSLPAWAQRQRDMAPHVETLTRYARDARTIIEFGVRGGVSTWALLDGLPATGRMWSVDIARHSLPARISGDPRWTLIIGDDRDPWVQDQLPAADLVLIDTSHEYQHTLAELRFAATRRPRRIVLHDAEWPGVVRAMREFSGWRQAAYHEAHDEYGGFSLATLVPA